MFFLGVALVAPRGPQLGSAPEIIDSQNLIVLQRFPTYWWLLTCFMPPPPGTPTRNSSQDHKFSVFDHFAEISHLLLAFKLPPRADLKGPRTLWAPYESQPEGGPHPVGPLREPI